LRLAGRTQPRRLSNASNWEGEAVTLEEYERAHDEAFTRLNAAQKAYDAAWDAWRDARKPRATTGETEGGEAVTHAEVTLLRQLMHVPGPSETLETMGNLAAKIAVQICRANPDNILAQRTWERAAVILWQASKESEL